VDLVASVRKGAFSGVKVMWELGKVIVPVAILVRVLEGTGWMHYISNALAPLMHLFGVPGEGALVLVSANLSTVYAGLGTMAALTTLTIKQKTILAAMMMLCHSAISETALMAKTGAKAQWMLGARFAAMIVVGILLNLLLPGVA
jgi:hypothetical protein